MKHQLIYGSSGGLGESPTGRPERSMTPEPMVIRNHGYRGLEKLDQKVVPSTGHKPGQSSSKKYFSTIFRTGILRSFFWKGSQVARKPGL